MSGAAARAVGFAALCGFGLLHWMAMVEPAAPLRVPAALAVALLAAARPVLLLPALPAALLAGGLAPGDLWPGRWDDAAASIRAGLEGVGGARLPYAGSDPDIRLVIGLGGALLVLGAALLAVRSRAAGLIALGFLYGIPASAMHFEAEFLRGALLALLVVAYLRLERLRAADLAPALGLATAGAVLALAAGPALDRDRPWLDDESLARDGIASALAEFDWDHDYGGIVWPRDGREVLQVRAPRRTYWKAQTLDVFEGGTWRTDAVPGAAPEPAAQLIGVDPDNRERWTFPVDVSVRNLRSPTMPLAAVAESVAMAGEEPEMTGLGTWAIDRDLRRGDAYSARVYVPQPTGAELRSAVPSYSGWVLQNLSFEVEVPSQGGARPLQMSVAGFREAPLADFYDSGYALRELRRSGVWRTWRLSRRLLAGAETPYDYVRAIRGHLRRGFTYDETPPAAAGTLDGFLFDARAGFCQQYSGAMALLLRMGGVPARVATGFAPGSYDERRERYVVRDLDAHSWVEAWFDGIGWVVFDPTPAAAPPRSQAPGAVTAGVGDIRDRGTVWGGPAPSEPARDRRPLLVLAAVLALAGVAAAVARRPRRLAGHELERALRGAGEAVAPGTTLLELERRLGPGASAYLAALRAQRYGAGPGPSAAERRDLRRALTRGRRPVSRLRAWLALAPRPRDLH